MTVLLNSNGATYRVEGEPDIYVKDTDFQHIVNSPAVVRCILERLGKPAVIIENLGNEVANGVYDNYIPMENEELAMEYGENRGLGFYAKI